MATDRAEPYPVRFDVEYPEQLSRLTTLLRVFWVIPIAIVYGLLTSTAASWDPDQTVVSTGGFLFLPTLLLILFRQKYPRWWFDWQLELSRFGARIGSYFTLLRDEYPSTDEQQAVQLEIDYPDVPRDLNRWLPLVKWLLAIPHYIVLIFLVIGAVLAVIMAWFAILFTGRYPRSLFDFVVSVTRWGYRVNGYAFLLVTDRYPPFSFD